jgi:hypothetical protein
MDTPARITQCRAPTTIVVKAAHEASSVHCAIASSPGPACVPPAPHPSCHQALMPTCVRVSTRRPATAVPSDPPNIVNASRRFHKEPDTCQRRRRSY